MPHKPLNKMPISDRAKQFMPFAALRGHYAAIENASHEVVDKIELTEDAVEEIDYKLHLIEANMIVTVIYYMASTNEYIKFQGMVSKLNKEAKTIQIVDRVIHFEDILSISF